jgi:hypothetical protein
MKVVEPPLANWVEAMFFFELSPTNASPKQFKFGGGFHQLRPAQRLLNVVMRGSLGCGLLPCAIILSSRCKSSAKAK